MAYEKLVKGVHKSLKRRGLNSGYEFEAPTPSSRALALENLDTPTQDPKELGIEKRLGISNEKSRFGEGQPTRRPDIDPETLAAEYKKLRDTLYDVGIAGVGGRIGPQGDTGLAKYGMPLIEQGLSDTSTGNQVPIAGQEVSAESAPADPIADIIEEDAAQRPTNPRRLPLTPTMRRLMSGDLSALDAENRPFSPNLLRMLMGGRARPVKGATRLYDIARPQGNRFER